MKKGAINIFLFDLCLLIAGLVYYLLFLNRGMVGMDEGYMLHLSDRILHGQVPFRDFLSVYTPGYYYLIAAFFKLFGASIIISRVISLTFCLGIITLSFLILLEFKLRSKLIHLLTFLCLTSFGYPLMNIVTISWPLVFFVLLLILLLTKNIKNARNYLLVLIGFDLALILFFKQNFGLYFFLATILFNFTLTKNIKSKLKSTIIIALSFVLPSLTWIGILLITSPKGLFDFINFSLTYVSSTAFTYPPLSFLLQPFGLFKIIPYYLPIGFAIFVLYATYKKEIKKEHIYFYLFPLIGFAALIYPCSDLLHVYPFYGLILVGTLVFFSKKKFHMIVVLIVLLNISIGFYLTMFREYYRYELPYKYQNTNLNLPRAKNILVPKARAVAIQDAYLFIQKNTKPTDKIFVYPITPMLYFLFERDNPSKDSFYIKTYSIYDDKQILKEIVETKVKYFIVYDFYQYPYGLSRFIQKQKLVLQSGEIKIFEKVD